jgi:purine catabolism regulator
MYRILSQAHGGGCAVSNEWSLTVADVVKRPLFQHAEVVAGSQGLSKPIRWVHVLETADTGKFLNGGELILSTGLGFGDDPEKRLAYLSELIRRQTVGLCIELGTYIPRIPTDMLELADHHDFPLIVFHQPVRFVDITLDLHESIVNRQMQALRELESYSRTLQQLSLQAQGTVRLLQHFQQAVHTQVFFYPLEGAPLYVPTPPQSVQQELTELMRNHLPAVPAGEITGGTLALSDKKRMVYQPVVAMGHLLAYVGLVAYEREPDEYLLLMLDSTVSALAQVLMRSMFAEEQALASQDRLLDDLIANRPLPEEQIRSLLGIQSRNDHVPFHLVLMEVQRAEPEESGLLPPHDLTGVFRSLYGHLGFRTLIRCRGNRFYILVAEKQPLGDTRRSLERAIHQSKRIVKKVMGEQSRVRFGVSRPGIRFAEAGKHIAEAEQALAVQGDDSSPFFADLGLFRLLFHIPREAVLESFIDDYLGTLIAYDRDNGTQLLHTLRVYLDHNLSKQETADKLFIHRQTLYHRLEKIQDCLGETWTSPHSRLCLEIALHAYEWLKQMTNGKKGSR